MKNTVLPSIVYYAAARFEGEPKNALDALQIVRVILDPKACFAHELVRLIYLGNTVNNSAQLLRAF